MIGISVCFTNSICDCSMSLYELCDRSPNKTGFMLKNRAISVMLNALVSNNCESDEFCDIGIYSLSPSSTPIPPPPEP